MTVTLDEVLAELRAVRAELGELRARMRPRRGPPVVSPATAVLPPAMRDEIRSRLSRPPRKRRAA